MMLQDQSSAHRMVADVYGNANIKGEISGAAILDLNGFEIGVYF